MTKKKTKIDELREYYDNTDMSESIRRARQETEVVDEVMVSTSIRLPKPLMDRVRIQAEAIGVPATTLMRQWILDRLDADPETAVVAVADIKRFIAEHAYSAAA
ncbi:MAG: hypothetical protein H0T78_05875 [Longispora sp.]|nr:hypothetical protein [Longispora sp. (in: high G+C Gram-positive bacteria)]